VQPSRKGLRQFAPRVDLGDVGRGALPWDGRLGVASFRPFLGGWRVARRKRGRGCGHLRRLRKRFCGCHRALNSLERRGGRRCRRSHQRRSLGWRSNRRNRCCQRHVFARRVWRRIYSCAIQTRLYSVEPRRGACGRILVLLGCGGRRHTAGSWKRRSGWVLRGCLRSISGLCNSVGARFIGLQVAWDGGRLHQVPDRGLGLLLRHHRHGGVVQIRTRCEHEIRF